MRALYNPNRLLLSLAAASPSSPLPLELLPNLCRFFLFSHLPVNLLGEELRDQPFVVRPQLNRVDGVVALGVEVVRVESFYGREGLEVFFVGEVGVGAFAVPSVGG